MDELCDDDSLSSEDGLPPPIPVAGVVSKLLLGTPEVAFEAASGFVLKEQRFWSLAECLVALVWFSTRRSDTWYVTPFRDNL